MLILGEPYGTVYLITNKIDGKRYIGQTVQSIRSRCIQHNRKYGTRVSLIRDAMNEFGKDNFYAIKLAEAYTPEDLNELERFYIQEYNTIEPIGYNVATGGTSGITPQIADKIGRKAAGRRYTKNPKPINRASRGIRKSSRTKSVIGTHIDTGEEIHLESMSGDKRFDARLISACCRGKRKYHREYSWRYNNVQVT